MSGMLSAAVEEEALANQDLAAWRKEKRQKQHAAGSILRGTTTSRQ